MRNRKGATLALTVAVLIVLLLIGIFIFFGVRLFAGAREMANVTDSGGLNCGKQLITSVSRPLNPGIEAQHFSYLVDTNGNVDLRVYNRIIAQTLLIGLNAQAEGTTLSSTNANQLLYAVQGSPTSISKWLADQLSQPSSGATPFGQVANANSLRMLGLNCTPTYDNAAYAVSYINQGQPTNVFLDQSILPGSLPGSLLSSQTGPSGFPYLMGYQNVDTGIFMIEGTPVMPGQQPHLIANRDFDAGISPPMTGSGGYVPPNAFRTASTSTGTINTAQGLATNACAVVGVLGYAYTASIPEGYLQITNSGPTAGSLPALLSNVNPTWAAQVTAQLVQRMRETQPAATASDAATLLNGITVGSGATVYIYLDPASKNLTWTTVLPPQPTYGAGMAADGNPQSYVNQVMSHNSWVTVANGTYTPSCGFNNLLGALVVANYGAVSGDGTDGSTDGGTDGGSDGAGDGGCDGGGGDGGGGGGGDGGGGGGCDGGGGDGGDGGS